MDPLPASINQKITFEFLKSHLWSAADILRGSLDPSDYRHIISKKTE
ncbi:MAG: type I restriction-modification system subunit M N-terminal domain-containing protein [Thermoproteota archaeon]|nr:type I restriction-modification system subunit M N-terminal domain-containing protein [Thermoproteota archaeon]